jgi:hypothetical protein
MIGTHMNQPNICNKNVAPGCEPFSTCEYGIDDLSNINKKELVHILCDLHKRYDIDGRPDTRRKISAMRKALKILGINQDHQSNNKDKS